MRSDVWACVDCLMLLVNGEPNPEWSPLDEAEHVTRIEERFPTEILVHVGDESSDVDFSWSQCDTCGSTLGGSRYRFAAIRSTRLDFEAGDSEDRGDR